MNVKKCLACGNDKLRTVDTEISDFVMARIAPDNLGGRNYKTKLCYCPRCGFAFYDYRLNDEEAAKLYAGYREREYQQLREKYECWYTEKINAALNEDRVYLREQQRHIEDMVFRNVKQEIKVALDYGGNEGRTFTEKIGTKEQYVYDISGVKAVDGVKIISDHQDLKEHVFDFIMCNHLLEHLADPKSVIEELRNIGNAQTIYYIEVPSENPFEKGSKFSIRKNLSLLINPKYNKFRLIKYYLQQRKAPFMPMKEHINFFTMDSLRLLAENHGYEVLEINESRQKTVLGKITILSACMKLRNNTEL